MHIGAGKHGPYLYNSSNFQSYTSLIDDVMPRKSETKHFWITLA